MSTLGFTAEAYHCLHFKMHLLYGTYRKCHSISSSFTNVSSNEWSGTKNCIYCGFVTFGRYLIHFIQSVSADTVPLDSVHPYCTCQLMSAKICLVDKTM